MTATSVTPYPDLVQELTSFRDSHNALVTEALKLDPPDFRIVNEHQPLGKMAHEALETIRKLTEVNALMTEALRQRIIVALQNARQPAWVPTHRHYKGKLYRVTGQRMDAEHEELEEKIEYDDADGGKFVLSRRKWESLLPSGRPRYEYIYQGSEHGEEIAGGLGKSAIGG